MPVTEGEDGCSALAGVCVSSLMNRCLVMSHQVCRVRCVGWLEANSGGTLVKPSFVLGL